ncbi:SCY1-like protein 2 [Centruroides vittatus]|uniref:SCY1-like protein 2 n=1 Tax=Centruroides vittatus TaxID=120091 RepID=UPI00350FE7B2
MEMLNKLKSTVSSLSTVLPGNPVTREYEIEKLIASSGPSLIWKVYKGIKRSTKQEAAVFVLEKKQLERYSKQDRDHILEILKKGVSQLTRLRHPSILTVQHPLEESRESLAFATEPVFASLANILGNHENLCVPPPKELKEFQLYDIEIKYGLLQVTEGLAFLHNDVKLLHHNICPESIIINKNGAWKIFGFDFCIPASNPQDSQPAFSFREVDFDRPPITQPHFNYIAPEYVLTMSCDTASDMFSLGALMCAIFNKGNPIINNYGSLTTVKKNFHQLQQQSSLKLDFVPADVREHVKMLLSTTPEVRPDAFQFSKLQFFEDVGVKTLQYLDSLYQWDNLQKSHFYKGLPQILTQMTKRVALQRILPCLVKEYANVEMVPFVLPSVLLIAEQATKEEFCSLILPDLIPIFQIQEPVQIMLIFLQKMNLLLNQCPPDAIRNHVLPMIYCSLEADAQQIQELCLSIIPSIAALIEYSAMKNSLLPRIKKLCLHTSYLSVRVNCLVCIGNLLEHLDKWLVLDEVLPMLPQIPSKEPAVLMGILGIYKLTMTHKKLGITKDIMASKVIPFLMPLTIENGLTLNQFNALVAVVKEMVGRVESEQRMKLEQLNSIRQEQNTINMSKNQSLGENDLFGKVETDEKAKGAMENMFQNLGLNVNNCNEQNTVINNSPVVSSVTSQYSSKPSLSMEEKTRLAWEQEQQQRLKSQAPLKLSQPAVSQSPHKPKDLTSTLISSNLSNFTMTGNMNLNNTFNPMQPVLTQPVFSPRMPQLTCVNALSPHPTYPMTAMPPLSVPQTGIYNYATPQKNLNMSSLDNLLPQPKLLSMNQMPTSNMFQKLPNFTRTEQTIGSPPLQSNVSKPMAIDAKSELDDLLGM